jgi:predicted DNA-binding transcriptional regulator YafY
MAWQTSGMLETSARLLRLLSLLQTPREWTGTELADRLEVSTRTVRNDVERLRTLGYPVHATRGAVGGYRLGAGAALPPLLLDDEEAVAVAVGLRTAAGGTVAGVEETSLRALAKLEQVLPARLRRQVNALHSYTVRVPHDEPGPRVDADTLTVISAACRDRERLRFDYARHDGTTGRRDVEPYRLVNWGRRWYLVAYDPERADWRTFRVDRIGTPAPAGLRFPPRELPEDVVDRVRRGVSSAAWRHRARITVHAPAEVVAERINPAVGTVEAVDPHTCVLHTGADRLESVAVWVGLLGVDFTVEGQPELAELLRTLGERYLRAAPAPGPAAPATEGARRETPPR